MMKETWLECVHLQSYPSRDDETCDVSINHSGTGRFISGNGHIWALSPVYDLVTCMPRCVWTRMTECNIIKAHGPFFQTWTYHDTFKKFKLRASSNSLTVISYLSSSRHGGGTTQETIGANLLTPSWCMAALSAAMPVPADDYPITLTHRVFEWSLKGTTYLNEALRDSWWRD